MNQENKQNFVINGFHFGTKDDIEIAQQELSAVQYIDKKIENKNMDTVLSVYNAALEKKIFRTPVGYSYLHELQKRMRRGGIEAGDIQSIPLYQIYNDTYKTEIRPVRVVKKKEKKDETRKHLHYSVIANVVLAVMVIALFVITITGENANVLNYRQAVLNEYSQWEEELTDREKAVRDKERELNISVTEKTKTAK